jgi:hypothetical protein
MNPLHRVKEEAAAGERVERTAPRSDEQHRRRARDSEETPDWESRFKRFKQFK